MLGNAGIDEKGIDLILDALCYRAIETMPRFRFRPFLSDPKDDLFVECALASGASLIVTDDRHFREPALAAFGVRGISAKAFIESLLAEGREP